MKKSEHVSDFFIGAAKGNRTPITWLRTMRPNR